MALIKQKYPLTRQSKKTHLWFEKGFALIAAANYILVLFETTYIPLRDFWLQGKIQLFIKIGTVERSIPGQPIEVLPINVAQFYDWVKGIEPNRDTTQYLKTVEELAVVNEQIANIASKTLDVDPSSTLASSQDEAIIKELKNQTNQQAKILESLRQQSIDMVDSNPFLIANKTGTLEKIKNRMRDHVFKDNTQSAKKAFTTFWNQKYLEQHGFRQELNFFDQKIRPLMETNYYRPIGENGEPVNNFAILDFPFFVLFLCEFLARTWYISRTRTGVSWFDAMLWRWYDVFLLIPFWRWLRIIPLTIRLSQAELIDLHKIQKQASQGFVAGIAEDITEVVFVQAINQAQGAIKEGAIDNILSQTNVQQYIDINDTNETVEITKLVVKILVFEVIPKIRPDAETLIQYTIERIIDQSSASATLKNLPGFNNIKENLAQTITKQLYQVVQDVLQSALTEDKIFDELLEKLGETFMKAISSEIQAKESIERIDCLLVDLLEEIKINFVERLSAENVEDVLEQTRALRQMTKTSS